MVLEAFVYKSSIHMRDELAVKWKLQSSNKYCLILGDSLTCVDDSLLEIKSTNAYTNVQDYIH